MNKEVLELRDKRGVLLDEVDALLKAATDEKRNLTDDEHKAIRAKQDEAEKLNADIRDAEVRADQAAKKLDAELRAIPGPRALPVESRKNYEQWPVDESDQFIRSIIHYGATRQLPQGLHNDYRSVMTSVLSGEYRAPTGMGTLIDQEGGFLVPSTISSTILQKSSEEGQILSKVQNVPITVGNTTKWNAITENARTANNRYGGITVSRTGEGNALTASKAKFHQIALELKKLTAGVYLTDEQLEDAPQTKSIIDTLVPKAIAFKTESEAYSGTGGIQMEGILNAASLVTVSKETNQAAGTILYENIVKMYSRMHASSWANAAWYINQDCLPQLMTMSLAVGVGGVPVFMPANGAAGRPFATLMALPIIPIEHASTVGTVGDIVLADFTQYLYANNGAVKSAQSMHVKFLEGEQVLRFTLRNDGKSWWSSALTPNKGSNTLSPFVALETR